MVWYRGMEEVSYILNEIRGRWGTSDQVGRFDTLAAEGCRKTLISALKAPKFRKNRGFDPYNGLFAKKGRFGRNWTKRAFSPILG